MTDTQTLERRLEAVERAVTDGDADVAAIEDASEISDRVTALEATLADVEDRLDELDAATQALRGYVGNVRSVNTDVEERADAAIAAVERLEARLDDDLVPGQVADHDPTEFATHNSPDAAQNHDEHASHRPTACPECGADREATQAADDEDRNAVRTTPDRRAADALATEPDRSTDAGSSSVTGTATDGGRTDDRRAHGGTADVSARDRTVGDDRTLLERVRDAL